MVVVVHLKPEFTPEAPRLLFEGPYVMVGGQSYAVTPDGQRFLVLEPAEQEAAQVTHLNVVLNWFEEVKRRQAQASLPCLGDPLAVFAPAVDGNWAHHTVRP